MRGEVLSMNDETGSLLLREAKCDGRRMSALRLLATSGVTPEQLATWCEHGRLYALCDSAADPDESPLAAAMTRPCQDQAATAEICALAVRPERKGHGLGRRLLAEVADVLLRGGIRRVVAPGVEVTDDQAAALENAGFCRCADGSYAREL